MVIIYDHVGTGYDCDVTLAGIFSRELYCSNCLQGMHAYMIACLFGLTHSSGCQNEYLNITLDLY